MNERFAWTAAVDRDCLQRQTIQTCTHARAQSQFRGCHPVEMSADARQTHFTLHAGMNAYLCGCVCKHVSIYPCTYLGWITNPKIRQALPCGRPCARLGSANWGGGCGTLSRCLAPASKKNEKIDFAKAYNVNLYVFFHICVGLLVYIGLHIHLPSSAYVST